MGICMVGCRTPGDYRKAADKVADEILAVAQKDVLGRDEAIIVDSPREMLRKRLILDQNIPIADPASRGVEDVAEDAYWTRALHRPAEDAESAVSEDRLLDLSLVQALEIAARNTPEFQDAKDDLYRAALALDLEADGFRETFTGALSQFLGADGTTDDGRIFSSVHGAEGGVSKKLRSGVEFSANVAVDLVKLLSRDKPSVRGTSVDSSITIPLLRGSGEMVQGEDLKQAERNVLYAIYDFERYKREFAVDVATSYMGVLRQRQQVQNREQNYQGLITATRRARRLADSGLLPEFQFDQAIQNELGAREGWISARQTYTRRLDNFKVLLGLPPETEVILSDKDLAELNRQADELTGGILAADYSGEVPPADAEVVLKEPSAEGGGKYELSPAKAIQIALASRMDLKKALGKIEDAKRAVYVAADNLRGEFTLLGNASMGGSRGTGDAYGDNSSLRTREADYSTFLTLNLPIERTAERNTYRNALISLEEEVRTYQQLEDSVKLQVREDLRGLIEAREGLTIQKQAVRLAEKRVRSTDLFLQAGRAAIRDLLDARSSLLTAQNALTDAVVAYRLAELELQRDIGKLDVSAQGLWQEFQPED